jgi:RNA polymerase sigma factor (sigma-70 family)
MPSTDPIPEHGCLLPTTVPRGRPHDQEQELVALVQAACAGNSDAWTRLVERFDCTLRRIARSYRLAAADVDEVVQATWLDLVEDIERIREPRAIGGWLATATRRSALRRRQAHAREQPTDDHGLLDRCDRDDPETSLLELERRTVLLGALATLPDRHRRLLTVLLTQPTLDYRHVGKLLSMPVGSIGPTRARALERLACDAQLRAISNG